MRRDIQGIYRGLVDRAWRVRCDRDKADVYDKVEFEKWYRKELLASPLNIYTTKQVHTLTDEDAICLHFAMLTGDEKQIAYWSCADERRAMYVLRKTMAKAGVDNKYVVAMAKQMGYMRQDGLGSIDCLPAELILKLNAALDMHAHRSVRKESHACA